MVFHMKTTLLIEDSVFFRLKAEAAKREKTMSELVEAALRLLFEGGPTLRKSGGPPPLPTFHGGHPAVDLADRDALEALDGEPLARFRGVREISSPEPKKRKRAPRARR